MRRPFLLIALLMLVFAGLATPAHAGSPLLVLSSPVVVQNERTNLTLSGFDAEESISLWLTLPNYTVLAVGDLVADASGAARSSLPISTGMPVGAYSLSARGNRSGLLATAALTVQAAAGAPASAGITLTVSQRTQPQGECFDFTGAGYAPAEKLSVWLRLPDGSLSSSGLASDFSTDSAGAFSYYICFGRLAAEGPYTFTAYGQASQQTGIVTFSLVRGDYLGAPSKGTVLIVDPSEVRQLDTVTVLGGGFEPGEQISLWITLPNGVVQYLTSGFTQDGTFELQFALPALPVGKHYISAYGHISGMRAVSALSLLPGDGR